MRNKSNVKYLMLPSTFIGLCILLLIPANSYCDTIDKHITVHLKNGYKHHGLVEQSDNNSISITSKQNSAIITYSFENDNISRIETSNKAIKTRIFGLIKENLRDQAITEFQSLYSFSKNYFLYLDDEEIDFFIYYIRLLIDAKEYAKALIPADDIFIHSQNLNTKNYAHDMIVLIHHHISDKELARLKAEEWIHQASDYHHSAIGWWVLSKLEFDSNNYQQALQNSLRPIVFSSQTKMPYLNNCYTIAAASWLEIKQKYKAIELLMEMQSRNLEWPDSASEFNHLKLLINNS